MHQTQKSRMLKSSHRMKRIYGQQTGYYCGTITCNKRKSKTHHRTPKMQSLPSLEAQHKTVHRVSAVCHCRCSRSRRQHIPFNQHASGGTDRFRHGSCCWFPREKVAVSFERRERTSQASYVFVLAPVV